MGASVVAVGLGETACVGTVPNEVGPLVGTEVGVVGLAVTI